MSTEKNETPQARDEEPELTDEALEQVAGGCQWGDSNINGGCDWGNSLIGGGCVFVPQDGK